MKWQPVFTWIAAAAAALAGAIYIIKKAWVAITLAPVIAEGLIVLIGDQADGDPVPLGRRLAAIEEQLSPNGGKTLRDRVDRIEDTVSDISRQLEALLVDFDSQ